MPTSRRGLSHRRQPDRTPRGRDRLRQLLHDARREARPRPGVQFAGGRPGLPGPPGRRAQLHLLEQPVRPGPRRHRQEDSRERLPDDHHRRLGGGIRRHRSGALAADSRAGADERGDAARVAVALRRQSPRAMGPGLRPAQAGLHRRIGRGTAAGTVHTDSHLRGDASGGEGLVRVRARPVHERAHARRKRSDGLLGPPQRLLDGAHRADVHGRPGAAHRLRQRRQPADRPRVHAPEGNRRAPVARRVARTARTPAAGRESRPLGRRRRRRTRRWRSCSRAGCCGWCPPTASR